MTVVFAGFVIHPLEILYLLILNLIPFLLILLVLVSLLLRWRGWMALFGEMRTTAFRIWARPNEVIRRPQRREMRNLRVPTPANPPPHDDPPASTAFSP